MTVAQVNSLKVEELKQRKTTIEGMGGAKAIDNQHRKGKLTARERIARLVDPGTFHELDALVRHRCGQFGMASKDIPADAVITGYGKVSGRTVFLAAQDFTSLAGTFGEMGGQKMCKAMDLAAKARAPFIQLLDSGGARLQEGQDSSEMYAQLFRRHTMYNGVIPQISIVLGTCAGGAAYGPALGDFIIQVKGTAYLYMGGPAFVRTLLGYEATEEELGGSEVHATVTGLADFVAENDDEAIDIAKELLSYLPNDYKSSPQQAATTDAADRRNTGIVDILPASSARSFDMSRLICEVLDDGHLFQVKELFAPNMITGYGRLNGRVVGVVANQSTVMGGVIDVDAADKAARFVRICDSYNIPLIQFQDSPAVMIGKQEEVKGIIRHGSKMLFAYTEATVPKITLVVRKSYAGAQLCMCSKPIGADIMYAWPTAEITLVGPATASSIIFAKEIAEASNPDEVRQRKLEEFAKAYVNPYVAAERGYIDDVIDPEETRIKLIAALESMANKSEDRLARRHANMQM